MTRQFGRIHRPDRRDAKYAITARKSKRKSRYWQSSIVADQGNAPSCVGHAWSQWLACSPRPAYLVGDGLYRLCKFEDEWAGESYDGTSVRAGAKIAQGVGILSAYKWAKSKDALIYTLLEEGPVVCGTSWYEDMMEPTASGMIEPEGEVLGGHAYLSDGINVASGLVRIKNSWGESWGEGGRAWIMIDDLWSLIKDDGEACLGVKQDVRRTT